MLLAVSHGLPQRVFVCVVPRKTAERWHENFRTESIKPKIIFTPGTELKAEMGKISYKIEN